MAYVKIFQDFALKHIQLM